MVHGDAARSLELRFMMGLARCLGAGYEARLARSCFACRTNLLVHGGCFCGSILLRSCDRVTRRV